MLCREGGWAAGGWASSSCVGCFSALTCASASSMSRGGSRLCTFLQRLWFMRQRAGPPAATPEGGKSPPRRRPRRLFTGQPPEQCGRDRTALGRAAVLAPRRDDRLAPASRKPPLRRLRMGRDESVAVWGLAGCLRGTQRELCAILRKVGQKGVQSLSGLICPHLPYNSRRPPYFDDLTGRFV